MISRSCTDTLRPSGSACYWASEGEGAARSFQTRPSTASVVVYPPPLNYRPATWFSWGLTGLWFRGHDRMSRTRDPQSRGQRLDLRELGMNDVGVFMPVVDADPHLFWRQSHLKCRHQQATTYLSECTQSCQDTSSNPSTVLPLRRRKYLDSHVLDCQPLHLVQEAVRKAFSQCRTAAEDNVSKQVLSKVHVGSVDIIDHQGIPIQSTPVQTKFRALETSLLQS